MLIIALKIISMKEDLIIHIPTIGTNSLYGSFLNRLRMNKKVPSDIKEVHFTFNRCILTEFQLKIELKALEEIYYDIDFTIIK
jgi:hypothetical protein